MSTQIVFKSRNSFYELFDIIKLYGKTYINIETVNEIWYANHTFSHRHNRNWNTQDILLKTV